MTAQPPAPVVPTPASLFADLRGRRVIVGVPGLGFREDLRADDAVVQGGRTYIPVLAEQDYYRAETEQIEVFAPLVPIDRVWVEYVELAPTMPNARGAASAPLDSPPRHDPVPIRTHDRTMGRRLVQAVPDGHVRDIRAATNVYLNASGVECVRICTEPEWYRWVMSGTTPSTVELTAVLLWVE